MNLGELLALLCVHVELTAAVISVCAISISKLLQQYYDENVQCFSTDQLSTKLFLGPLSTNKQSKTQLTLSALNLLRSKCFMTLGELLALLCVHVELTAAVISVRAISISKLLQQYYGENVQYSLSKIF